MDINSTLIYFVCFLAIFLLILACGLLRNIFIRARVEEELQVKNEEITAFYEEIAASEDELKKNFQELMEKQEELYRSEQRYRIVAESTMDIIWEGDLVNKRRIFSDKLYDVLGYKASEMEPLNEWFNIVHPKDIEGVKRDIQKQIDEKIDVKVFEYRVRSKDGIYKWIRSNTRCEFDEQGRAVTVFGAFTDITELKAQQQKIKNLAYFDAVTGLPNRVMLRDLVAEEINKCKNINSKFALLFIDLDDFKLINDSYGHIAGDKLLMEVGRRFKKLQNENMMAFRLGGDEFIILIKAVSSKEDVEIYCKALYATLDEPILIDRNMFCVTHSTGIVLYPESGLSFDELLKNADTAMYKSKEYGKSTYTFYHRTMGELAIERIKMQSDLHKALENNEFVLYYQPIVEVTKGNVRGFEALIRWMHPEKGLIFPDKFINVAEESGMIIEMGKWVILSACKYAKSFYDRGFTNLYVSVNVSTIQVIQRDFTDFVLNTLESIGLPPELLLIEITESVLMESMDLVIGKLKKLKDNNVKIALDDFGCGYSSLKYLKMLPINTVKIDKSFIDDVKSKDDAGVMAGTIIILAKQLGLTVIGEGVEEREQLSYLEKHGCEMFQGYLACKPVPEIEIDNLLSKRQTCMFA